MPKRKPASCLHRAQLGRNVVALRKKRGLTQERLAEKSGISARYIQSVEAGEYFPSMATLVSLKGVLRCSWDELFKDCEKA